MLLEGITYYAHVILIDFFPNKDEVTKAKLALR